jgi:predicted P-loop ATPase
MNISYYNSLPSKGQPHKASGTLSIIDFINDIKFGKWKDLVDPIRKEKDKSNRDAMKKRLMSVTMSGVFEERKEQGLIKHSGFICVDIDNFTDKTLISKDKYTYACFDSVSGNGFAVVVKINPSMHKESFKYLQKYYFETYGIVVDPLPSNVASLRFVSYDQSAEINEKSSVSKFIVKEVKPKSIPLVLSNDAVSEAIKQVVQRGVDITDSDYHNYLNLSFSIVDGFGESGRVFFHSLASTSDKYDSRHADRQYDIAIKRGKTGISVGTFYYMLKQKGIQLESNHDTVIPVIAMGKKAGRTKEAIEEQIIQINKVDPSQAKQLVAQVFDRDINIKDVIGNPEQLISSMVKWIKLNYTLKRNTITKALELNGEQLKKEDLNTIYLQALAFFNTNEITYDKVERIILSNYIEEYNPINEYIEANRHRNGEGNIDQLCSTIQTNTVGFNLFIRKWLISIIAAHHGNPVRSVLVLVGGQNTGKTEWFRRLLPDGMRKYYAESKLDAGKDDDLLMTQKLVIMDDEMGGKSKHDEKRFKELTSKSWFSLRAPYGRHNEDFKRLAVLCGTSNLSDIITDRTGNTRFLPIDVLSINHAYYNNINKDELFMEAVRAYESGEDWLLTKEELSQLSQVSEEFESINNEKELVRYYFRAPEEGEQGVKMTATMIKGHIERCSMQQIRNIRALGIELKSLFGSSKSHKSLGKVYSVIEITFQKPELDDPKTQISDPIDPKLGKEEDEEFDF